MKLVIDNGTGFIKAGFNNNHKEPNIKFPTNLFELKDNKTFVGITHKELVSIMKDENGDSESKPKKYISNIYYPIEHGIIKDWDKMQIVWESIFDQLKIEPNQYDILLTESSFNSRSNREKLLEIMFEKYNVQNVSVVSQAFLSLYMSKRESGVVIESGDGITQIVPIIQNRTIQYGMKCLNFGGSDLTDYMMKMLSDRGGYPSKIICSHETVNDIKEQLSMVTLDYGNLNLFNNDNIVKKEFKLPDGKSITIGNEIYRCPETLFQPALLDMDPAGIHLKTFQSINDCNVDKETQNDLYTNIVLSGGNTMFTNLNDRLKIELKKLVPSNNQKIKIISNSNRIYNSWLGGSILSSHSSFNNLWLSKDDYYNYINYNNKFF